MEANFQPLVQQLTESTSIFLAQNIESHAIATPLSTDAIATTYVHQGKGGTPILLLHGLIVQYWNFGVCYRYLQLKMKLGLWIC